MEHRPLQCACALALVQVRRQSLQVGFVEFKGFKEVFLHSRQSLGNAMDAVVVEHGFDHSEFAHRLLRAFRMNFACKAGELFLNEGADDQGEK